MKTVFLIFFLKTANKECVQTIFPRYPQPNIAVYCSVLPSNCNISDQSSKYLHKCHKLSCIHAEGKTLYMKD